MLPYGAEVISPEGDIIECSPSTAKMLGYEVEDLIGSHITRLLTPESVLIYKNKFPLVVKGEIITADIQMLHKNGAKLDVIRTARPLQAEDGSVKAILAISVDITERKKIERELKEKEFLLDKSQQVAGLGSYILDIRSGFWVSSQVLDNIFGIDKSYNRDVNGWLQIVHPLDRKMMQDYFTNEVIGNSRPFDKEYRILSVANEMEKWVHGMGELEFDQQGNPIKMIGTIQDITERKIISNKLVESELKYRNLFENAIVGIGISERSGRVLAANRTMCQITGYPHEELLGVNISQTYVNQKDRENLFLKIQEQGEVENFETAFFNKQGDIYWANMSIKQIIFQGREALISTVIDISERKRTEEALKRSEEQLRQAQKLESLGQLAGGIAHDFNNILTAIIGYSEIVLENQKKNSLSHANLNKVIDCGIKARDLVQKILAFSRKQMIQPVLVNVNESISAVYSSMRRMIGEDIRIELNLSDNIRNIKADPTQLEQILINLFVNARDAINLKTGRAAEKKIVLETKEVYLDNDYISKHVDSQVGYYAQITVNDNGVGMTPDVVERIFDPFFTTKGIGSGTGLGLATVYGIVKQNQGSIYVYSEPGKGTTFNIYWPVSQEKGPISTSLEKEPKVIGGTENILVVEDEEMVRNVSVKVLKKYGYQVYEAANGKQALKLVKSQGLKIDLLLTDLIMPEMNGQELASELAVSIPDMEVLYCSGYSENILFDQGMLKRDVDFLAKPFNIKNLALKVREILNRKNHKLDNPK